MVGQQPLGVSVRPRRVCISSLGGRDPEEKAEAFRVFVALQAIVYGVLVDV